jgi:pimeloyl-ACP methyl ester carboxylesterase
MSFASALSDSIARKFAVNLLDCRLAPQTANQEEGAPGSDDVTLKILEDSGHTFMLENNAAQARETVSEWLTARGF